MADLANAGGAGEEEAQLAFVIHPANVTDLKCSFYKNPFIKTKYGIGNLDIDRAIEIIRRPPQAADVNAAAQGAADAAQPNMPLRNDFKRYILPHMMKFYKDKYHTYSSLNGIVSVIVYLSDYYRQFVTYHMNQTFNPTLIEINRLIESENKIKSNKNKDSNVDKAITEMTNVEEIYFERNAALKGKYRELLSFLANKYYGVFREYSSFLYNYYLIQFNALQKYRDLIERTRKMRGSGNFSPQFPDKGWSKANMEIQNAYGELVKIFPSEITEAIPSSIDEIFPEERETNNSLPENANRLKNGGGMEKAYKESREMAKDAVNLMANIYFVGKEITQGNEAYVVNRELRTPATLQLVKSAAMTSQQTNDIRKVFQQLDVISKHIDLKYLHDAPHQAIRIITDLCRELRDIPDVDFGMSAKILLQYLSLVNNVHIYKITRDALQRAPVVGNRDEVPYNEIGRIGQRAYTAFDTVQSEITDAIRAKTTAFRQLGNGTDPEKATKKRAEIELSLLENFAAKMRILGVRVEELERIRLPNRPGNENTPYSISRDYLYFQEQNVKLAQYIQKPALTLQDLIKELSRSLLPDAYQRIKAVAKGQTPSININTIKNIIRGSNQAESMKVARLNEILRELQTNTKRYGKDGNTLQKEVQDEETNYRTLLNLYDNVLKSEKQEERAYKSFQKVRATLYGKLKELGGGVQDKKYSSINEQYKDAYAAYTTAVNGRISAYETLVKKIDQLYQASQSGGESSDRIFKTFDFQELFKNDENKNSSKPKDLYNFFRNDGVDEKALDVEGFAMSDDKINLARIQRLRVMEKILIQIESEAKAELEKMEQKLAEFKLMKKDAEDEYSIIKSQKDSMNANRASKEEELKSLKTERDQVTTKYEAMVDKISKKELEIARLKTESPELGTYERMLKQGGADIMEGNQWYLKEVAGYKTQKEMESDVDDKFRQIFDILMSIDTGAAGAGGAGGARAGEAGEAAAPDAHTPYTAFDTTNGQKYKQILDLFNPTKLGTLSKSPGPTEVEAAKRAFKERLDAFIKQHFYQPGAQPGDQAVKNGNISEEDKGRSIRALFRLEANTPEPIIQSSPLYEAFKKGYMDLYALDVSSLKKEDAARHKRLTTIGIAGLTTGLKELDSLTKTKDELAATLSEVRTRIKEIETGPRMITALTLAKKAYLDRFPILLTTFEGIIAKKVEYNTQINRLVAPFEELTETIYQLLMKRESIRYKIEKKKNVQSSIYEAFTSDPLYKLIKSTKDLIQKVPPPAQAPAPAQAQAQAPAPAQAAALQTNNQPLMIPQDAGQQLMRSIYSYVTLRNENFVKAGAIINTSEINSKKHVLQTMIEMMKGVKIGSFAVPIDADSKKIVERMERKDIDEVTVLLSDISAGRVTAKNQSVRSFPEKYGKYFSSKNEATNASSSSTSSQALVQTGGANGNQPVPVPAVATATATPAASTSTPAIPPPSPNSALAVASTNNKVAANKARLAIFGSSNGNAAGNKVANKSSGNSNALFMEMIYQMLLTQGDERINMVVNKIKETEQDLLQTAANYINLVKIRFNGEGNDKVDQQLKIIKAMCERCTTNLETDLTTLMKQITTSSELLNIRLIKEYIFMEVILVYLIVYFIRF